MPTLPLVSVNILTYNHKKYIGQALESIISQITSFNFEIVICDDCSTDNTIEIIKEYYIKYPDIIRYYRRERNFGIRANYFENIKCCLGKYIAICDGDDYWIDKNKLQKQIEFLENNLEYSMCFQNAIELFENEDGTIKKKLFRKLDNRDYFINEIIENWIIPTASVVFRNNISYNLKYLDKYLFFDIILFIKLGQSGKIRCLNSPTCVYRRHKNSYTNKNLQYKDYVTHLQYLNKEFNNTYKLNIKRVISIEYLKQIRRPFLRHLLTNVFLIFQSVLNDNKITVKRLKLLLNKSYHRLCTKLQYF